MKINVLHGPPADIFKNRRKLTLIFVALLLLAFFGVLMGGYAIYSDTNYYDQLETLALAFFVAPSPFAAYIGEKLQGYKKLTPPQHEELAAWGQQYPEVKLYCNQVEIAGREPVRAEYEACHAWVEEAKRMAK